MRPLDFWIEAQIEYMKGNKDKAAEYVAKSLGGEVNDIVRNSIDKIMDVRSEAYKLMLIAVTTRERRIK